MSDLRIRILATGLATYPDVAVICGPWERDRDDANTVLNPSVLVEVLSPSAEDYDRGEKLDNFKRIPTLRACLLFAHARREVEIWLRDDAGAWQRDLRGAGQTIEIDAINATLEVDAIYDDATEPR